MSQFQIFMTRGRGEANLRFWADKGRRVVWTHQFWAEIICEQPLVFGPNSKFHNFFYIFEPLDIASHLLFVEKNYVRHSRCLAQILATKNSNKKSSILLVLPFMEISLQPELFSLPCFRFQGGYHKCDIRTDGNSCV